MDPWLASSRDRIAGVTGVAHDQLSLSESDVAAILDLARVAAHESGDRTNAPLVCYLVGLALGGGAGVTLADAAAAARGTE